MLNLLLAQAKSNLSAPYLLQMYISTCNSSQVEAICHALPAAHVHIIDGVEVAGGVKLRMGAKEADALALTRYFRPLSEQLDVDIACVAIKPMPNLAQQGVLFMDMDSTLIQCECIDEIADFLGIKAQISSITQQAMEGKLDFSASLVARVKLLAGLDESVLQQVYQERIRLTDGAVNLIQTVQQAGWKIGLVSGGFTYFTSLLQQRLKLDFVAANTLEIIDGKLTGNILGDIVDAQAKQRLLKAQCLLWDIDLSNSMALGDGANDLPMLDTAGLGIAFHAKPKVRELAPYAMSHGGLAQALHLLTDHIEGDT